MNSRTVNHQIVAQPLLQAKGNRPKNKIFWRHWLIRKSSTPLDWRIEMISYREVLRTSLRNSRTKEMNGKTSKSTRLCGIWGKRETKLWESSLTSTRNRSLIHLSWLVSKSSSGTTRSTSKESWDRKTKIIQTRGVTLAAGTPIPPIWTKSKKRSMRTTISPRILK